MKKRLFGIFLSLALVLSMMPMGMMVAQAEEPTAYDLWVAGTQVTSANAANLSVIDGVTVTDDGEVSYDSETNTLTLKNASINGAADVTDTILVSDSASEFKIAFTGTNTITARDSSAYCRAVNALGADLVLSGGEDATLTIRANMSGGSEENGGLRVGSLTITGGTVTVECPAENYGPAHNPYCISLNKNAADVLKVTGGKLISKGWEPLFYSRSAFTAERVDSNTYLRGTTNTDGTGLESYDYTTNSDYSGGSYNSTYRYVEAVPNEAGDINIAFTVTPPKAGESTAIIGSGAEVSSGGSDYIISGDQYATSIGNLYSWDYFEGKFAKDTVYYSYALIVPTGDNPITSLSGDSVAITGGEFVDAEVNEYGEAKVYFKVTIDENAEVIDTLNINVTVPQDGQVYFEPDPTTGDANYTIESAVWIDGEDNVPATFEAGVDYTLDLLMKPARGHVFADKVGIVLNGENKGQYNTSEKLHFNNTSIIVPVNPSTLYYSLGTTSGGSYTAIAGTMPYDGGNPQMGSMNISFDWGSELTLTAIPDKGYTFKGWYEGVIGENHYVAGHAETLISSQVKYQFIPTADGILCAVFEESSEDPQPSGGGVPSYKVEVPDEVENGSVTVKPTSAKEGDTVTIMPTPDEGFVVDDMKVTDKDGKEIEVKDNGDGTYSFVMPASKVSIEPVFKEDPTAHDKVCPSKAFEDLDTSLWYHEGTDFVISEGMMNGVGEKTFAPNDTTTRAMIVTILWRMEGEPEAAASSFTDVEAGSWYEAAVNWAAEKEIVKGMSETTFAPTAKITREQMATILARYAEFKGKKGDDYAVDLSGFTDLDSVSDWALDAMNWSVATELMKGVTDTTLDPKGNATRAQVAVLMQRLCENIL